MNEMVRRVAAGEPTTADYECLMARLGYEVRPHARMFRRLQMSRPGDNRYQGVPDLTSALDATLFLTTERTGGRFIEIIQTQCEWTARWLSYDSRLPDGLSVASSKSLGAAMWAAWAGSAE